MISTEFDYNQIRENSLNFGIKQYKDSLFRGELHPETQKRHGKGVIIYHSGRVYEGDWVDDKREGSGYELYQNGNTY